MEYRLPRNKYQHRDAAVGPSIGRSSIASAAVPGVEVASLARSAPQSGNGSFLGLWRPRIRGRHATPCRARMPTRSPTDSSGRCRFRCCPDECAAPTMCRARRRPSSSISSWRSACGPADTAVGKRLRSADVPGEIVVVGVVGNTRPRLLSMPVAMQIYGCLRQQAGIFATVIAQDQRAADVDRAQRPASHLVGRSGSADVEDPDRRDDDRRTACSTTGSSCG